MFSLFKDARWSFILAFAFLACQGNEWSGYLEKECQIPVGGSCSSHSFGGQMVWVLDPPPEPGTEYLLFVVNNQPVKANQLAPSPVNFSLTRSSATSHSVEKNLEMQVSSVTESIPFVPPPIHVTIPSPANITAPNFNLSDYYVPNAADYTGFDAEVGETTHFHVRENSNVHLTGRDGQFTPIAVGPGLKAHVDVISNASVSTFSSGLDCFSEKLDWIETALGPLKTRGSNPDVNVLITPLQTPGAIGMFNLLDRFETFKGQLIPDSNLGQNIYISPNISGGEFCSTSIHEYQHAYNYDQKVLRGIASLDLNSVAGRQPEDSGPNEAYSHIFEELTGEYQRVFNHLLAVLRNPNQTPLNLDMAAGNQGFNTRTRGLNVLILYHALRLHEATLSGSDERTLSFLKALIDSENIGYKNIADHLQMSEAEFMESFFKSWGLALYYEHEAQNFIPAPESTNGVSRGIQVLDRQSPASQIPPSQKPVFHPLQADIPFLNSGGNVNLRPSGIAVYRYITPEVSDPELRVSILTKKAPLFSVLVRVR